MTKNLLLCICFSGLAFAQVSAFPPSTVGSAGAPNTVVIFGDSITANNTLRDSVNYEYDDFGYFTWANALLRQRFTLLYNAGISANTTAQMLARIQTDVIAYRPAWCFVLGGINDVRINGDSAATVWGRLKTIYTTLAANQIRVVALTIPAATYTSGQAAAIADVNNRIREYARITANFYVVDAASAYADSTSNIAAPLSGYTSDGIHPSKKGAYAIGKMIYDVLNPIVPAINSLTTGVGDLANLVPNPMMIGTGGTLQGTPTGEVANTWVLANVNTATCVGSKTARTDGWGAWQTITLSGGAGGTGYTTGCLFTYPITSGYSAGDVVVMEGEVSSSTTTVQAYVQAYSAGFDYLGTYSAISSQPSWTPNTDNLQNYTLRSPPFTIPATTAYLYIAFEMRGTAGVLTVGRASVRKVPTL